MNETKGYIDSEGDYVPGPDDFEGEEDTYTIEMEGIETEALAIILGNLLAEVIKAHRSEATITLKFWTGEVIRIWPDDN